MATSEETSRSLPGTGVVLALLLIASAVLAWLMWPQGTPDDGRTGYGRIVASAQNARSLAAARLAGESVSSDELGGISAEVRRQWGGLTGSAGQRAGLGSLAAAGNDITLLADSIDAFAETDAAMQRVDEAADRLQRLTPQLLASARSIFSSAEEPVNEPFERWLSQSISSMQSQLARRGPDEGVDDFLADLEADFAAITTIVLGVTGATESPGIESLVSQADPVDVETTQRLLSELMVSVAAIVDERESLNAASEAWAELDSAATALSTRLGTARPAAGTETQDELMKWALIGLLGVSLVLLVILLIGFVRARNASESADVHAAQNERNQHAILRLLDELSNLADGDLTVRATVTEDITGAIADSINYAIEALRELVITVNDSSILVDAAAKQSESTAHHMVRASETQVKQAASASSSIAEMTASVEEISGNAERCSDVARHSVDVAHKGAEAVRRTIDGMNTIRETIQDTSKRIKRLGESSQEIGNIVELIEEIADQTNILALNASIEASRAGEASRGFAVVADEVQKLAERSTAATRKIEVLVSTIQSDTNEAVVSMERSTTDVVGGALLAENAGAALEEIEQVSHQIASLVQNISGSAREQNKAASAITQNMDVLREVSARTKQSTTATSSSISKLSELASQLRRTVSGFTLPNEGAQAEVVSQEPISSSHGDGLPPDLEQEFADDAMTSHQEAVGEHR